MIKTNFLIKNNKKYQKLYAHPQQQLAPASNFRDTCKFIGGYRFSYARNWKLVNWLWGQNFEEAVLIYILKREIEYLLQGLSQLVTSCLASLSILIHFLNYSEMGLLFFVIHYWFLYKNVKKANTPLSKNIKREHRKIGLLAIENTS